MTASRAELVLETRIDRVTVHRNGALVVRAGVLSPSSWPATVRVPGLPLLFQSDTVRVRAQASGVTAGPIEEEGEFEGSRERASDRRRERDALKLELKELRERDAALARLEQVYGGLRLPPALDLHPRARARWPDLDAWTALGDAAERGREELATERVGLRDAIREAEERLAALERALASEDRAPARVTRALRTVLRLEDGAAPPERLVLEVEYFVAGARWAPSYALDIGMAGEGARLRLLAWVAQATGEDWEGAALAFATTDLRRTATLPKLPAWKIGRAASPPATGWRPLPEDLDALYADYDREARARPAAPRPEPAPRQEPPLDLGLDDDEVITAVRAPQAEEVAKKRAPPPRAGAAPQPLRAAPASPALTGPPPAPPPPMQMASMPPPAARAPARKSAGLFRGRSSSADDEPLDELAAPEGFGGGAAPEPLAPPPPSPGRLLAYAWLRLPRWDEPGRRGRLWPVDLGSDLRALAEERGDSARVQQIERALAAVREGMAALSRAPLPPGCVPIQGSSFQHRYPFGPRVMVPSDGRFVQVPAAEGVAPSKTLLRVVPRQTPQAFRTVRLGNPLQGPVPAGPVRVTVDGDVRVAGTLGPVGAGGQLSLDLGLEEGLRVARNATYQESEKGMLSAQTIGLNQVRLELASRLDAPVTVQVFERLPLAPEGGDLQVALESASSPPTRDLGPDGDKVEGALRWEVVVPPRGKVEIAYSYAVRVPARMEVVGGARREP